MIRYFIRIALELLWADWVYVGSFDLGEIKWDDVFSTYSGSNRTVVIAHCYESRWGTRHTTLSITGYHGFHPFVKRKARRSAIYMSDVKPWLRGRPHKNIPSFSQVTGKKWDFKKLLKGETPFVLNDDEG